jgi:hypothetical protein
MDLLKDLFTEEEKDSAGSEDQHNKNKEENDDKDPHDSSWLKKPQVNPGLLLGSPGALEMSVPRDLSVRLSGQAFSQLFGYADATRVEVSLLGIVDRDGAVFTVREFFLVEQSGHQSHTETDPEASARLMEQLIGEGRTADVRKLRCWAHSHPGMDVFWSRTDDNNCQRMVSDWLVSLVVSDGFKLRCRIDLTAPLAITLDKVPVFLDEPVNPAMAERCRAEVDEKIRPLPLLKSRRKPPATTKETPTMTNEEQIELLEYCDLCGGWHADGDCPMQMEESAYEMTRHERMAEYDPWGDDSAF